MKFIFQISIALLFLFLGVQNGYSQIITSKKVALAKGIYQKPEVNISVLTKTKLQLQLLTKSIQDSAVLQPKKATIDVLQVSSEKVALSIIAHDTMSNLRTKALELIKPQPKKPFQFADKEDKDLIFSDQNYLANQIVNNALPLVGTAYKTGGTTTSGMDCSGMVTAVFNNFDIKLPRSSVDMANVGLLRKANEAEKGDLIFFKTNNSGAINHVGLVVEVLDGEIKFIHASIQKGVMISSTKEEYYRKNFVKIKKVL